MKCWTAINYMSQINIFKIILYLTFLMPEMSHLGHSFSSVFLSSQFFGNCDPEWPNCHGRAEKSNQFPKPLFFLETDIIEVGTN